MAIQFKFNQTKAVEAILYIAHHVADPTYHTINKILYFADKTSLERYGRFICGDTYYAMKYGPVPSQTYDLMKESQSGGYGFEVRQDRLIVPLRKPDFDQLSESDLECLDQVITMYGTVPVWKRTQDSHDKAWEQAWQSKGDKNSKIITVESLIELLEDSEDLLEYVTQHHNE